MSEVYNQQKTYPSKTTFHSSAVVSCACLLIALLLACPYLVTDVPCYELNTQQTATSGKWCMQKQNPTFFTAPVCFLCNVSPEIMILTHVVRIRAVLFSLGHYIV